MAQRHVPATWGEAVFDWLTFEREQKPLKRRMKQQMTKSPVIPSQVSERVGPERQGNELDEAGVWPEPEPVEPTKKWTWPSNKKQIIPCHHVDSKVIYEGKVWTVSQINLATGEHVITRPPALSKANLRMLDLEPFIDEDEVL